MPDAIGAPHQITTQGDSISGKDAVCFTAGVGGAPFGAGVVHAYLAADREPPAAVAGISFGALSAAAMQRAYREIYTIRRSDADMAANEAARWRWFRNYVTALWDKPMAPIWDAIPDQQDFFADLPPIRDNSVPASLREQETAALRARYLLEVLGRWLAGISITVGQAARVIVAWIRYREEYDDPQWLRFVRLIVAGTRCGARLLFDIARAPHFVPRIGITTKARARDLFGRPFYTFRAGVITCLTAATIAIVCTAVSIFDSALTGWSLLLLQVSLFLLILAVGATFKDLRPLLGWSIYSFTAGAVFAAILAVVGMSALMVNVSKPLGILRPLAFIAFGVALVVLAALIVIGQRTWRYLKSDAAPVIQSLLSNLGMTQALVHPFYFERRLTTLFADFDRGRPGMPEPRDSGLAKTAHVTQGRPRVDSYPMPILILAAPLQPVNDITEESHIRFEPGADLIKALRAAMAVPPLFPPVEYAGSELAQLAPRPLNARRLDLVDASQVRQNPLFALFEFLKQPRNTPYVARLDAGQRQSRACIHVVYTVPIRSIADEAAIPETKANIVDIGLLSLELSRRRDTQMELDLVNFISSLENLIREAQGMTHFNNGRLSLWADEIAPEVDVDLGNPFDPDRDKILKAVASGCRRTLENVYATELSKLSPDGSAVPCARFLETVASSRRTIIVSSACGGLPEVCHACTGKLQPSTHTVVTNRAAASSAILRDGPELHRIFPQLTGTQRDVNQQREPRIVFVASGGVFRGSFHVGTVTALAEIGAKPDLIVGASVGTIIGGVLGLMFQSKRTGSPVANRRLIARMVDAFLFVDRQVALTRQFKLATRELGVRARHIALAPRDIRQTIRRGTRSDAAYAALGAPPALVDAVSDLFLLPNVVTRTLASNFVAGHVAQAAHEFVQLLKGQSLSALGVESALLGSSLLELLLKDVFSGVALETTWAGRQPFQDPNDASGSIAFFGTATDLGSQAPTLLGANTAFTNHPYSFVEGVLASSAFPAVFSPRRQSNLVPGSGRIDVRLADGGMFDNLPFLPAIEVLSRAQREYRRARATNPGTVIGTMEYLRERTKVPDLFIAASLDPEHEFAQYSEDAYANLPLSYRRSKVLGNNVKLRSFDRTSRLVHKEIQRLLRAIDGLPLTERERIVERLERDDAEFLDGIVDACVLPIYPVDRAHLNPTFAFCRSMSLDRRRVAVSIAHGCYRTFLAFANPGAGGNADVSDALHASRHRLSTIQVRKDVKYADGQCPYFLKDSAAFACPFAAARYERSDGTEFSAGPVYTACVGDALHKGTRCTNP